MDPRVSYALLGAVLGGCLVVLIYWAYRQVARWVHRRRYGVHSDRSTLLLEHGRRMTSAEDPQSLGHLLATDLPQAIYDAPAVLLLAQEHQLVDVAGGDLSLAVSHVAVRWVASAGEAQFADRGRLYKLIEQGRADLGWTRVWVPLMRGFDLQGMWLLGARGDGLRYAPADLTWLTSIGRQAAIVLESLHYAERERWVADEMRALYRQLVAAREVERSRISRELHDGVLQDLCAVTRDLKALTAQTGAEDRGAGLSGAGALYDATARSGATVQALRAICNDLRPPLLQQDLVAALKALVTELDVRSHAPIHIEFSRDELNVDDDVALAIFRITQEALHNAIQHADASEVAVRLTRYPDHLRLTVTDDGRGIAGGVAPGRFVSEGHFGLAGMRERAAMIGGHLEVQTAIDYGTIVVLTVPLQMPSAARTAPLSPARRR